MATMVEERSFLILFNPTAGSGRSAKLLPLVQHRLEEAQAEFQAVATTSLQHACQEARKVARSGEVVVAMGGDGLFGALAGEIAATGGLIGLIPAGRGNDFARVTGIPSDPAKACEVLLYGSERLLDMGEANGHPFVGIASTGLDSVANGFANSTRLVRGRLAYAYGGIKALVGWQPATFSVQADNETWSFRGYSVAAANSKAYGGGMMLAPGADLTDGKLDLVTISHSSKWRFLSALPKVFKGAHVVLDQVEVRRVAAVEIDADRPFAVYADGEKLTHLPATVKALPAALRMILPPSPFSEDPVFV